MDEKGQTTIEYIMLLAGILMLTVVVFVILRENAIGGARTDLNRSMVNYNNATNTSGYV
jgi:hypothetical protein